MAVNDGGALVMGGGAGLGVAARTALLKARASENPEVRLRAEGILRVMGRSPALLIGDLRHPDRAIRLQAMEGLVEIGTGFGLAGGSEGSGRSVRIAGKDQSAGALAHYVQLVWVIPEMDGLFTGPASERRRFLDRLMLAIDPKMSGPRGRYDRAMRQRNRLFQMREGSPALFAGLEEQMAEAGVAIAAARLDAVARLSALIQATHEARGPGPFPFAVLSLEGTLERALVERPAVEVPGFEVVYEQVSQRVGARRRGDLQVLRAGVARGDLPAVQVQVVLDLDHAERSGGAVGTPLQSVCPG